VIESVKEKQESELLNNARLRPAEQCCRLAEDKTRKGAPTPDDLDEFIDQGLEGAFAVFLRILAPSPPLGANGTRRGVPPPTVTLFGTPFLNLARNSFDSFGQDRHS